MNPVNIIFSLIAFAFAITMAYWAMKMFRMSERLQQRRMDIEEKELAVREQFIASLTDAEQKLLDQNMKPYLDLLVHEIEEDARARAEVIYREVRDRIIGKEGPDETGRPE